MIKTYFFSLYKNVTMGCGYSKCSCEEKKLRMTTMDNTPTFELPRKTMKCKVIKVYDGDTIWVSIILHGRVFKFNCRMLGYDSPEMKPSLKLKNRENIIIKAKAAKDYLSSLILNNIVDVKFSGFDKYGRALTTIFITDPDSRHIICANKMEVNTAMIRKGHGYSYMGGKKKEF